MTAFVTICQIIEEAYFQQPVYFQHGVKLLNEIALLVASWLYAGCGLQIAAT